MHHVLVIATTIAAGLLAGVVAAWLTAHEAPEGAVAPTGGDFTLQSADGPVALATLRGNVVL